MIHTLRPVRVSAGLALPHMHWTGLDIDVLCYVVVPIGMCCGISLATQGAKGPQCLQDCDALSALVLAIRPNAKKAAECELDCSRMDVRALRSSMRRVRGVRAFMHSLRKQVRGRTRVLAYDMRCACECVCVCATCDTWRCPLRCALPIV